jgi:hypothetical protein
MTGIYIRIEVEAPKHAHAPGMMIVDRSGAELLPHSVRVYQCDGDALLSVIRSERDTDTWQVRVNDEVVEHPDRKPLVLKVGDVITVDQDMTAIRGFPLGSGSRGVWSYTIAEIGPIDSAECTIAGLRHLLARNVNTDAIPFIERALADLLGRGIHHQLAPIRALQAKPPPCVSEVQIRRRNGEETVAYIFGTYRSKEDCRRYLCFTASPDYHDTEPTEAGKLVYFRNGEADKARLVEPTGVAGLVEANAAWLAGGDA